MSATEDKTPQANADFEKSLTRLEALVKEMEGGTLSLDQMMTRFEEGIKLSKICGAKLNEVEKKIEKLVKTGGRVTTAPLDATGGEAD